MWEAVGRGWSRALRLATIVFLIGGCGERVETFSQPTEFVPAPGPAQVVTLAAHVVLGDLPASMPPASRSKLKAGVHWRRVGTVKEGTVYECADGVFLLGARHNHEAQLVVSGSMLVGVYLPVDGLFTPLEAPAPIRFK